MTKKKSVIDQIFTLISFFIFSICYSQNSVSGVVVDEKNKPIEFANVFIQKSEISDKIFGSTTNGKGEFNIVLNEMDAQNKYRVTVSFIGFETWTKTMIIDKTIDLNIIVLKEESSELQEIIIISKTPTITKVQDKIIFNVQNSPLKSGYNGVELLKNTPLVWVDENESILMRNETATILINGQKVNMSGDNLATYLSNLNSGAVKSIEIQTNKGASTDATSTGGIINIILKEKSLGIKSQVNLVYSHKREDYYSLYPSINVSYGSENWNIYGNYNRVMKNSYLELTNDVFFNELNRQNKSKRMKKTKVNRNSFKLGFVREINIKHNLGIEVFGRFGNTDYSTLGKAFYYLENSLNDNGLNNTLGNSNKNNINGILNYSWKISPKDQLNTFVDYSTSTSKNNSSVTTTYEEGSFEDNINTYDSDTETTIYAIQTDYIKTLKNDTKFELGVKFTYSDRDNNLVPRFFENPDFVIYTDQLSNFNYRENVLASYVSFDQTFKEKNYLKVGVRMENTDLNKTNRIDNSSVKQNYTSFFPSIYFSRKLTPKKTLSASYSRSLRRPSFRDLNNDVLKINDFQFVLGNPDLQPEFIDKYELSYHVKKNNITLYYNKTNEAINGVYFLEEDIAYYKKFNVGSQLQYGIEYSTSQKLNDWWYLNFSSYLFNRKYIDQQENSMFEKATLGIKIYNNFKINKTTSIDLSSRYISPKSDAFYEASEYYNIDIGLKKTFLKKKISLRIDVKDIFNTLEYRNKRDFSNYTTIAHTKPITRFLSLRLMYNFSNNNKLLGKKNKSKNDNYKRL
jgi:outer membrane receptor protein involved in Fe transport